MPKLIFAAATAWISKPSRPGRSAQEAHAGLTRSREATRRLRASRSHEAWFDLSPLDLARRH